MPDISKLTMPSGIVYNLKDEAARRSIEKILDGDSPSDDAREYTFTKDSNKPNIGLCKIVSDTITFEDKVLISDVRSHNLKINYIPNPEWDIFIPVGNTTEFKYIGNMEATDIREPIVFGRLIPDGTAVSVMTLYFEIMLFIYVKTSEKLRVYHFLKKITGFPPQINCSLKSIPSYKTPVVTNEENSIVTFLNCGLKTNKTSIKQESFRLDPNTFLHLYIGTGQTLDIMCTYFNNYIFIGYDYVNKDRYKIKLIDFTDDDWPKLEITREPYGIPDFDATTDEGKILKIVNGQLAWINE